MEKIACLFFTLLFAVSGFSQNTKLTKITSAKEEGQQSLQNYLQASVFDAIPPPHAIPGADGFLDYITNGANLNNIYVGGNQIIVSFAKTDSTDPRGSSTSVAYYIVSNDGGVSWDAPIAVSALPNMSGYPEINFWAAGESFLVITGRKYTTAARGGAWYDTFFGLGLFQSANVQEDGRDFFGSYLGGNLVGGLSSYPNAPTGGTIDTLYFMKYDRFFNTFSPRIKIADPSLGQIGGNVRYILTSERTPSFGTNILSVWYKDTIAGISNTGLAISYSSNNGTSWTAPAFIQKSRRINDVIEGDSLTPWFGIDAAFKPNSPVSNYGVVWSTLYANTSVTPNEYNSTGKASKILFYSPAVNGGVPTIVAGRQNMSFLSDTSLFNDRQNLQVGVLPVSHPTIAYSADGLRIYVAFSAFQPGDSLDGFTFNDIWYTYSDNGGLTWASPKNLTSTPNDDELYPTISLTGNSAAQFFHIRYQSTKGPGSQSFMDIVPTYKVYQCYQKVRLIPTSVNNISTTVPGKISLKQNYPNPFNPATSIRFDVVKSSKMSLKIYDLSGKLVETLIDNESVSAGTNEVVFDASNLSSGVYLYTLSSENFRETKKMMLVK